MSTTNDERGTGRQPAPSRSPRPAGTDDRTTASPTVPPLANPSDAMMNTTEIPVTTVHPGAPRASRDPYYGGGEWYRDPQRRPPVPVGIRITVWFLVFIFVLALIFLAVVHYHPSWVSFLRATSSSSIGFGLRLTAH